MFRKLTTAALFAFSLAACGQQPPAPNAPAPGPHKDHGEAHKDHAQPKAEPKDHSSHTPVDDDDFNWDTIKPPKVNTPAVELKNEKDPVTLKPARADITADYKGHVVRFESEATRAKFQRKPLKYLNMLSLEPAVDGGVKVVDASTYQDAVTDLCPFMPESEVDPHGTVYILHRGWKFFFCCWTGCGDKFMKNPAAVYGYYGLKEADGKLVRK